MGESVGQKEKRRGARCTSRSAKQCRLLAQSTWCKDKPQHNESWVVIKGILGLLRILAGWVSTSIASEFLTAHWPPLKSMPTGFTLG